MFDVWPTWIDVYVWRREYGCSRSHGEITTISIIVFFRCRQVLLNRKRSALDWPTLVHKPLLELKDICFTDCELLFWTGIKMASETDVLNWYSLSVLVLVSSFSSFLLISCLVQVGLRVSVFNSEPNRDIWNDTRGNKNVISLLTELARLSKLRTYTGVIQNTREL